MAVSAGGCHGRRVRVDDDIADSGATELLDDPAAHPAVAAHQVVPVESFHAAVDPPFLPGPAERPADDQLDHKAKDVQEDCHTQEDEHGRQRLGAGALRGLHEPGGRDRDQGAIEGGEEALAVDDHETDRAHQEDRDERERGVAGAAKALSVRPHGGIS